MKSTIDSLKAFLTCIFILLVNFSYCQPYIISSTDGYANIRSAANSKAKVLTQLNTNTIILLDPEEESEGQDAKWLKVLFYQNAPFTLMEEDKMLEMKSGYVHQSQIKSIEELEKVSADKFRMSYQIEPFKASSYRIKYHEGSDQNIKSINDMHYFLADCGLPKTAIKNANAKIDGKTIAIPNKYIWGIIAADNNFTYYQTKNAWIAFQTIGDGSCFNYVVWVFEKGNSKLQQRFVGWEY